LITHTGSRAMSQRPQTVVGAVIVDAGRVLAARRIQPAELAGHWEFPGGKVEPGENPGDALTREIREELGATIEVGPEVVDSASPWRISDKYMLRLFLASLIDGDLVPGADHDLLQWVPLADLDRVVWLPPDRLALGAVRAVCVRP
jgi:8-oxo-dGTP diphosphatase